MRLQRLSLLFTTIAIVLTACASNDQTAATVDVDDKSIYMATLLIPDMSYMEALNNSILTIEDGCLFADSGDERVLIIWQPGYFVTDRDGEIVVVDKVGEQVATVGEKLYLGGGHVDRPRNSALRDAIPDVCDMQQIFRMGEFLPEEYRDNVD